MKTQKLALLAVVAVAVTGCDSQSLIQKVVFLPSDNLETIQVALEFGTQVQTDLQGLFEVGSYGSIFADPYTSATQPFEVGFNLNTSVFNDQSYVNIQPTMVLPNGVNIGIDHALVQINGDHPISSKFDIYGYVDVLKQHWLGTAAIFTFLSDKYFPADLQISQVFKRDSVGNPEIIASVFGPTLNADGTLHQAGGIALFADVMSLIHGAKIKGGQRTEFTAREPISLSGKSAAKYASPRKLMRIQNRLIEGMNRQ